MSGFIPGLADWALRGGAGDANNNDGGGDGDSNNNDNNEGNTTGAPLPAVTEEEMRRRRLARMEALQRQQQQAQQEASASATAPMEVDDANPSSSAAPMDTTSTPNDTVTAMDTSTSSPPRKKSPTSTSPVASTPSPVMPEPQQKKKAKESHAKSPSAPDSAKKLLKKKELLLKKILGISLKGSSSDSSMVALDIEAPPDIDPAFVNTVIAERLGMALSDPMLQTSPSQKPLIHYLGNCYRKAAEQLQTLQQNSAKKDTSDQEALVEEILKVSVSFAASALMVDGALFEQAQDAASQLAKCLFLPATDGITVNVNGKNSSFYYKVCEELLSQGDLEFENVIGKVATDLTTQLSKATNLDASIGETSALGIVTALTSLCAHTRAALVVANSANFLLPAAGTPEANRVINPGPQNLPPGANLFRLLAGAEKPYKTRSGPGLEKHTVLGNVFRVALPQNNPAFNPSSILRSTAPAIEGATSSARGTLRAYQGAIHQLMMSLIKNQEARQKVISWLVDCMVVNVGASAMRPDSTKVSSNGLLLNVCVELLKLCDPFVGDETRHHRIDPTFVASPAAHQGIFPTTGDDAVPRLAEAPSEVASYQAENTFIPFCFFVCARVLHLSIVPQLSQYESLLRHLSHLHWELESQNRDIHSEPQFAMLFSRQKSMEVALFQEDMVADVMRFCNLLAKVIVNITDEQLGNMPEHFVDNICTILMKITKFKPELLRGLELRYVFSMVVKLLSPSYAGMVRNYNLRAMLGDVLADLYLPSDSRRKVPSSISCDPMAGGQTFLLSDPKAQETLASSLLLLYGEVEHTGHYDKMSHRAKLLSLIKYLWESPEHRPAFKRITQNTESFIVFSNGIINETNALITTVMVKLPEIREAQEKMEDVQAWGQLSEEEQKQITDRLEDNEREVRHALPLCNKTLQMFGYLNTDGDIRSLFLLEELCSRLVGMLLHVLTKLVGAKGLELKVKDPEKYEFRPKEMLRDLCSIFGLFANYDTFQVECAKCGCEPSLLRSAAKTCRKLNLLTGESMTAFESLSDKVEAASRGVADEEELWQDAPEDFMDAVLDTVMKEPVILPSGNVVDRSTIMQHLLNDTTDPFNRQPMTIDDAKPATELKARMDQWIADKRAARGGS